MKSPRPKFKRNKGESLRSKEGIDSDTGGSQDTCADKIWCA